MLWDVKKQDQELLQYYQKLIHVRKQNPCLTVGDPCEQIADDGNGLVLIRRKELLLVFHGRKGTVSMPQYQGCLDLLTGGAFDGNVGPYQAMVLKI
jgi:hypothetical protein